MRRLSQKQTVVIATVATLTMIIGQACQKNAANTTLQPLARGNAVQVTTLNSGTFSSDVNFPYQLLKLTANDGSVVYAQWFPPPAGYDPVPAVLVADPYDGIDWSGDPVDQAWAARPGASAGYLYPDVNGPNYVAGVSQSVAYNLISPLQAAPQAYPALRSGLAALIVYGRFYAGGDFSTYAKAMVTGLNFLGSQASVDSSRIGIAGISLGGFEALFGAADAPAAVIPKYGVALAPPVDTYALVQYYKTAPARAQSLFDAYARRIYAVTHGDASSPASAYDPLMPTALLNRLTTHFLLIQDDWDTLVPVSIGRNFVAQAGGGGLVEGLWFPHTLPIDPNTFAWDHTQTNPVSNPNAHSAEGLVASAANSFTSAYLLTRLISDSSATIYNLYTSTDTAQQFSYFHAQQKTGSDISSLLPRLLDLADPRVKMGDTVMLTWTSGAAYVAGILTTYWPATVPAITPANVRSYLMTNGLPPP